MNILKTLVLVCLAFLAETAQAQSTDACLAAHDRAGQEKVAVPGPVSDRKVAGTGKLYFLTAPDSRCRSKNIFVIPNDRLAVYAEYGAYAEVIYWDPVSGEGTAGWVPLARLADNTKVAGVAN